MYCYLIFPLLIVNFYIIYNKIMLIQFIDNFSFNYLYLNLKKSYKKKILFPKVKIKNSSDFKSSEDVDNFLDSCKL